MFVHGSPGTWDAFLGVMSDPRLVARAHVMAIDRPGFGGSSAGGHEPSLARQAEAVAAVLRERSPGRRALLVGHSYGGPVIARLAMDHPEQVAGLVLVAASIDPKLEQTMWIQRAADSRALAWTLPSTITACNRELMALRGELEAMLPLWEQVRAPVTVIQGDADRLVPAR